MNVSLDESNAAAEREAAAFNAAFVADLSLAYIARGRQFRRLPAVALKAAWVNAFDRTVYRGGDPADIERLNDLSSELRLRGLAEPVERVGEAWAVLRRRIEARGPHDPALLAAIARWSEARERAS